MLYFKTYDEQIEILKSRGMTINDNEKAKRFLEVNNYYNVINAYKDIFIDNTYSQEIYKKGVSFNDFIAVWSFDKFLRLEFSRFSTLIERTLKSKIAYVISNRYGIRDIDYLNVANFNQKGKYLSKTNDLILKLFNQKYAKINKQDSMICNCVNKYGCVPMWVFANIMSFSDIMKFYECINESIQIETAQDLSVLVNKKLTPKDIIDCGKTINLMRNLCAHDLRVYNFKPYYQASPTHPVNLHCNTNAPATNLFAFACSIYSLTDTNIFKNLISTLFEAFSELHKDLNPIFKDEIFNIIKFPANWTTLAYIQ